jgi:integrase
MTLGNYPALTLKEARERRAIYLNQLANNIDPINQIRIEEAKNSDEFSFERIARDWHEAYVATGKWNQATARKALSNFEMYVFPVIGSKPIDTIKTRDLYNVLSKIEEKGYLEIVSKTRQRFSGIFAYAITKGYIDLSPAVALSDAITITRKLSTILNCHWHDYLSFSAV